MNIIEKYATVFSFYRAKQSLIMIIRDEAKKEQDAYILGLGKKMRTKSLWHFGDYVYDMRTDKFLVYDAEFNHLFDLNKKGINAGNSSLLYIDDTTLILYQSVWNNDDTITSYLTYYENFKEKSTVEFCGKVLNNEYRLNLKNEEKYSNPTYFRVSNILDIHTYFEYQCKESEEVFGDFIFYKDRLVFYTKEKLKETYNSDFWINVLDIKSGTELFKVKVENIRACFDYEKGIFVAIKGINQNNEIIKRYEIVDVNNGFIDNGDFEYDGYMFAVGTAVQHLNEDKLYFADNVYSYEEQKRKAPKIGCFDIKTKQILFFEEVEDAEGKSLNQLIANDGIIYAKTNDNELYVLQQ